MIQKVRLIYQACMKIGKKDFNKFLDKFIALAEKNLQTTKLFLQKGDAKICIKYSKLGHFCFSFTTDCRCFAYYVF